MRIFDEKIIRLTDGENDLDVKVYLKEVLVKNNYKKIKAFCKIIRD